MTTHEQISDLVKLMKDKEKGLRRKTRRYKKMEYRKSFLGIVIVIYICIDNIFSYIYVYYYYY